MKPNRWEIENFVSKEFCEHMIQRAEEKGWEKSTIKNPSGNIVSTQVRNNDVCRMSNSEITDELFNRIRWDENLEKDGWFIFEVAKDFKIYRYSDPSQYFGMHYDRQVTGPLKTTSFVTMLIYLNEDFEGGTTEFQDGYQVVPKTGKAAFLTQNNYLHEAREVTKGTKYVMRFDLLYKEN